MDRPRAQFRRLFNNSTLSDVRLLIDGQTVYGHKRILSLCSPVFERMFSDDSSSSQNEIEGLSFVGFTNALRFIYGFQMDYELSDLYDSYLAAEKYLLHSFDEALFEYIQKRLNPVNSCLIYDQLIKIQIENKPLAYVRPVIIRNSKIAFESDHFKQISQETLVSLLSLEELSIDEFDLLVAVSKWIDCELQRRSLPVNCENRRQMFEPIKGYVLFTALRPRKVASWKGIVELLTLEEIGSLLLHLLYTDNPLMIELKTARRAGRCITCSVSVSDSVSATGYSHAREMFLSVNRRVYIQSIRTTYSSRNAANLSLEVYLWDFGRTRLDKVVKGSPADGKWCFVFNPPFCLEPLCRAVYMLKVTGGGKLTMDDQLSAQRELNFEGSVFFNVGYLGHPREHFIQGVDFFRAY